jgi:hypothetical protein
MFRNDRDILIAFYTYQYQNSSQYHLRNFQLLLVKIKCDSFLMHKVLCHPYKEGDLIWIVWYY